MTKEEHLVTLREQYIHLSRQYVARLQEGKSINDLKDMASVIRVLVAEIEQLEDDLRKPLREQ
jgi:flagellar biosynthesis chaperone FliJ